MRTPLYRNNLQLRYNKLNHATYNFIHSISRQFLFLRMQRQIKVHVVEILERSTVIHYHGMYLRIRINIRFLCAHLLTVCFFFSLPVYLEEVPVSSALKYLNGRYRCQRCGCGCGCSVIAACVRVPRSDADLHDELESEWILLARGLLECVEGARVEGPHAEADRC